MSPDGKTRAELALLPGLPPSVGNAMPDFMEPIKRCGGPMQYLDRYIANKGGQDQFAKLLGEFFQPLPDIVYSTKADCDVADNDLKFKLGDLGYSDLCTTGGKPRLQTSLKLVDGIQTRF